MAITVGGGQYHKIALFTIYYLLYDTHLTSGTTEGDADPPDMKKYYE